ncbi:class I SAM-dependent methyltransferase [Amycolatopsis rhizosphaerae]|uniref:Class I SAM-dependent methyltransferase n=1 Tax=Amycolatopsis rhizosphaerae TaxID=2053003 RepID=A0A558DHM9_9PSEU|nr:class I SAM-dependent methyltransferase [Amycolatopsis rhizosphaerae]TVT60495.1 class I SAM-dependent methyltransferase [Amycolatopsis rhizosphaerae]
MTLHSSPDAPGIRQAPQAPRAVPEAGRDPRVFPHDSVAESSMKARLAELLEQWPLPASDLVDALPLFLRRQQMADLLSMDELYRMVLDVPGVIMEFGVRHGRHLAAFTAMRGFREPHNPFRRIVGFDTFTGFPDVADVDRISASAVPGRFALPPAYPDYLRRVVDAHAEGDAVAHITDRTMVVVGDVRETLPRYLSDNPHTVIALAYFDLDIYEPTVAALRAVQPYLTRGSVLAFDEIDHPKWPGENLAVREVLGLDRAALRLLPGRPAPAYLVWGG